MKIRTFSYTLLLLIPLISLAQGQSGPIGWASVDANGQNGTTGGTGGNVVTVTTMADLVTYSGLSADPLIIQIEGMITITPKGRYIDISSNKTIVGIGPDSGISQGGFRVRNSQKNIIFMNLNIQDTFVEGDWDGKDNDFDGIQLTQSAQHVWVHKCTFLRQGDGALDITNGADYITVSHSYFGANNKVSLIGSSDTDTFTDRYKVTMHHNWFDKTTQRHPRVRFGWVHVFNNYYFDMGRYGTEMGYATSNGYGIGVGVNAHIWSEHNYFEKCVNPSQFYDNTANPGFIIDNGSYFVQSGNMVTRPDGLVWDPADYYDYALDPADEIKDIVMANAGAGENATSIADGLQLNSQLELRSFPNPFTEFTTLVFVLPEAGNVSISLFDITGRKIGEIANEHRLAGKNEIRMQRDGLRRGIYLISLEFKGNQITKKLAVH
jgi:pectate lyase